MRNLLRYIRENINKLFCIHCESYEKKYINHKKSIYTNCMNLFLKSTYRDCNVEVQTSDGKSLIVKFGLYSYLSGFDSCDTIYGSSPYVSDLYIELYRRYDHISLKITLCDNMLIFVHYNGYTVHDPNYESAKQIFSLYMYGCAYEQLHPHYNSNKELLFL
jgi:hypothetical protein